MTTIIKKTHFSLFIFYFSLLLMFISVASADFSRDDNSKIVTDNETGLQWQDNEIAPGGTWQDAINYCEALTLGSYDDWRLPNVNELSSIVDDTKYNPSMSPVFQSFASNQLLTSYYWSSTTGVYYPNIAWFVEFENGIQSKFYKGSNATYVYVRCVRAGQ